MTNEETLQELLLCLRSWEPQVCVLGNVRADDAINAITALRSARRSALLEAAEVAKEFCYHEDEPSPESMCIEIAAAIRSLADGEEKKG